MSSTEPLASYVSFQVVTYKMFVTSAPKNYLVKMTMSAGYFTFRIHLAGDSLIKEIPKHSYHPSTPKELAEHVCIPVHLLAINQFWTEYNSQQVAAYELMFVGKDKCLWYVALWSLIRLWGNWWMIIVFGNFFNWTIPLLNGPWNSQQCNLHLWSF